jgi:phosphatidylinositol-4,5-bisphosphate 3-kinase
MELPAVTHDDRKELLRCELRKATLPEFFVLPLNPYTRIRGVVPEKSRVMESKKKPLWLNFTSTKGHSMLVMFKAGDDLRQDQLTLQLLSVMDNIWKQAKLNMHMNIYGCISTGACYQAWAG